MGNIAGIDAYFFHSLALGLEKAFNIVGVHAEIAGTPGLPHPEHGFAGVKPITAYITDTLQVHGI